MFSGTPNPGYDILVAAVGFLGTGRGVQREPNHAKSDSDTTGTTLEEKTGENMERRRKAFYLGDQEADRIPEQRSSCDEEHEEKTYERRGAYRDSESGQKASDKGEGPYREDELREKTAQRILRR